MHRRKEQGGRSMSPLQFPGGQKKPPGDTELSCGAFSEEVLKEMRQERTRMTHGWPVAAGTGLSTWKPEVWCASARKNHPVKSDRVKMVEIRWSPSSK